MVDYAAYIVSAEWRAICARVKKRARYRCERCKDHPIDDVHHLTYARLGRERLTDLIALCRLCHKAVHKIRDPKVAAHEERLVGNMYRYTGRRNNQ